MGLSNTIAENHVEYQRDAILLSLIPYGVMKKECTASFSRLGKNAKRCVDVLEKKSYIQQKEITINSKHRKYKQTYIAITSLGVTYLAEKYNDIYPWLSLLAENEFIKNDSFSVRGNMSNNSFSLILDCQYSNVFFSESGVETMFERMQSNPVDVAEVIKIITRKTPDEYFPKLCSEAITDWWVCNHVEDAPSSYDVKFYDYWEINCGSDCPYNHDSKPKGRFYADVVKYRLGHVGLLQGQYSNFVVVMAKRDGVRLNPAVLTKCHDVVANQMLDLGLIHSISETPSLFQIIILCNTRRTGVSTFKHVLVDNRNLRPKSAKMLGIGTSATYLVPITSEAFAFALALPSTPNYEAAWVKLLSDNFEVVDRNSRSLDFPLVYKSKPCALGMSLNALHLNQCLENQRSKAVICHEWQVSFLRSVLPDILIVGHDAETHTLIEHPPLK